MYIDHGMVELPYHIETCISLYAIRNILSCSLNSCLGFVVPRLGNSVEPLLKDILTGLDDEVILIFL